MKIVYVVEFFFFFQAEDGIRDGHVTGVQTCALPILSASSTAAHRHFHDDLSELKAKLLTMSGEAQDPLGRALDAPLRRDAALPARTIPRDHAVDALEREIEQPLIELLATQQPRPRPP